MSEEFEIGDVVRLKSGGPEMTVCQRTTDAGGADVNFRCRWFLADKQEFKERGFPPEALEKV